MLKHPFGTLAFALLLASGASSHLAAQTWPARPITMVVPFAAGSGSDTVGRILAASLSENLGQQVVVENAGGAGGTTGTGRVAHANPDGYQFVLGGIDTFAMSKALYKKLPYNPVDDFKPVALVVEQPIVLLTRNSFPAEDLAGFIAYGKANPGKMQFGSAGVGSASHLACAQLLAATGTDAVHVPYRGAAPVMQDLLADRLDFYCALGAAALPQIESKSSKALAILTRERSTLLPDLKTASEQGVKDFDAPFWSGIFMPKATPDAVAQRLHAAVLEVMKSQVAADRLKRVGSTFVPGDRRSSAYLESFLGSEIDRWAVIIKASGITMN